MQMYHPKVSIVIPAYNAANYLAAAIDSALKQDYDNIEIVVVNDGSKDDGQTRRVAETYGDKIRYIEKENGGSSSALNVGIQNMTGDWFSWLSHDDMYYPGKVSDEIALLNRLIADGVEESEIYRHVCLSPADIIDSTGRVIKKSNLEQSRKIKAMFDAEDANATLISQPVQVGFYGCSCLIHKKAFEDIGLFDEQLRLLNDMDMWFRLYANGYTIQYIPEALVLERIHSAQISRSIGYSYHNAEQDRFWKASLDWLLQHRAERADLFYRYGKIAFSKTRYRDGREALQQYVTLCPRQKSKIWVLKGYWLVRSSVLNVLKQIYFKIR